jgi:hypothetical protein
MKGLMPNLHTDVCEHGFIPVGEMRRRIARVVSNLKGESPATYRFNALFSDQFRIEATDRICEAKTISDMRLHLARIFSTLDSDDLVTFSFHCQVVVGVAA